MSKHRIYQSIELAPNTTIQLDEKATHYVKDVLRIKKDEEIILFNGKGGEFTAHVTAIQKKQISIHINEFINRNAESPLDLILVQGIARGEKMDFIVQKAVELGVKAIFPIITERCNVQLSKERHEKKKVHWQEVAISACEQSGRTIVPVINNVMNYSQGLEQTNGNNCFILSPYATEKLINIKFTQKPTTIIIGPEGGLTDNEIEQATKKGFTPLNLGPRILRTETAAIATIAILQQMVGDM